MWLSHVVTINIVEKISEGHDVEVQEWSDRLPPFVKNPSQTVHVSSRYSVFTVDPFLPIITLIKSNCDCTGIIHDLILVIVLIHVQVDQPPVDHV